METTLIWAVTFLIFGIVALFMFRPAFSRLIDRTSGATKDGIAFERPQEGGRPNPILSFDELMNLPISATAIEREKTIEEQLHKFDLQGENEKISVLVRSLATSRVEAEFSNISKVIFGSQFNFLVALSSTTISVPLERAEQFFIEAKESNPTGHKDRTFSLWIEYLTASNLIIQNNNLIDLTQYGVDFLKYLVDTRQTYQRQG